MRAALIKIKYSCNNNCLFCHEKKNDESLKFNHFKGILNEIEKENIKKIYLSGGEPTTNEDFLKMIKEINNRGIRCGVITNGRMFYNKNFTKLTEKYVNEFHITLLDLNRDCHNSLTRNHNSFDETIKGLKNIKHKKSILINYILTRKNQSRILEFIRFCSELGIQSIKFSLLKRKGRAINNWNEIKPDVLNLLYDIKKIYDKSGLIFENFPLCAVGYHNKKTISVKSQVDLIYNPSGKKIFCEKIQDNEKIKPLSCKSICNHYNLCEGYLKEYFNEFNEFIKKCIK